MRHASCGDRRPCAQAGGGGDKDGAQLLMGRAAAGLVFVAFTALSAAASTGDVPAVVEILSLLSVHAEVSTKNNGHRLNAESVRHVLRTLGAACNGEAVLLLLRVVVDRDAGAPLPRRPAGGRLRHRLRVLPREQQACPGQRNAEEDEGTWPGTRVREPARDRGRVLPYGVGGVAGRVSDGKA